MLRVAVHIIEVTLFLREILVYTNNKFNPEQKYAPLQ